MATNRASMPQSIFKYTGMASALDILRSQIVWLSRPESFNDLFDVNPHHGIEVRFKAAGSRTRLRFTMQQPWELKTAHTVVLCLTESPISQLMWAHYGQQHYGVALEFDRCLDLLRSPSPHRQPVAPIVYTRRRPSRPTAQELTVEELFFVKGSDWAYEREWRVVDSLFSADGPCTANQNHWPFELNTTALRRVILGARVPVVEKLELGAILLSHLYEHVQLAQVVQDRRRYKLHLDEWERPGWVGQAKRWQQWGRDLWVNGRL